jgi:hypothetical protein
MEIHMSIMQNVRDITDLVRKLGNQELYEKLIELRDGITAMREENLELTQKIKDMTEAQDISAQLVRHGNTYMRNLPNQPQQGPFCMTCWDADRKLINLLKGFDEVRGETIICGVCDKRGKQR